MVLEILTFAPELANRDANVRIGPLVPPLDNLFGLGALRFDPPSEDDEDFRKPVLEYVSDSLVVHRINAVDYDAPERNVSRYRWSREELKKLKF